MTDKPATSSAPMATPHGRFYWNELMTRDVAKAKGFYAASLGWRFEEMPSPLPGTPPYALAFNGAPTMPVAGILDISDASFAGVPESWLAYIAVDDIDARVQKAMAAGGKPMKPPFDVPGVGRIAIMVEPGGAVIGWMTPATCAA